MQDILLSSGFSAKALEEVARHWRIIDIHDGRQAMAWLKTSRKLPAAVVVGHVQRPGPDGLLHWENAHPGGIMAAHEALEVVRKVDPELPVIISTSLEMPSAIVELVKRGAFDYVVEPQPRMPHTAQDEVRYAQELVFALKRAVLFRETVLENRRLKEELNKGPEPDVQLVGKSRAITQVIGLIRKVAPTPATVLVTGESGTGKELAARAIHQLSGRASGAFVAINCGTFSDALISSELFGHVKGAFTGADGNKKGLIQEAQAGTLFLDEIAAVSPAFQVSLLRVLENRVARPVGGQVEYPVNCRFVAAANRNLLELSRAGEFREDLYYRLNLFHIHLPALRERAEDIAILAHTFLTRAAREYGRNITGFDNQAMALLERFEWPGNVRQLKNAVERAVILCETTRITPGDLPDYLGGGAGIENVQISGLGWPEMASTQGPFDATMARYERGLLESALKEAAGNRSEAARILGMKRTTLYSRMKALGIIKD